ncbi:hypothetical protein Tco_0126944 [Tanacetum coccineum]
MCDIKTDRVIQLEKELRDKVRIKAERELVRIKIADGNAFGNEIEVKTENLTIYVSLIKQFWETTTARTLDTREVELTATIDGKVKIVTEASVRRHLQLADFDDGCKGYPVPPNDIISTAKPSSKSTAGTAATTARIDFSSSTATCLELLKDKDAHVSIRREKTSTADRGIVSIVKRNSYTNAGCKALGGTR